MQVSAQTEVVLFRDKFAITAKNAICISTINYHGFPYGRYLDLKSADDNGAVFCTYLDSAKGKNIQKNPAVAKTVLWGLPDYQARLIGEATSSQANQLGRVPYTSFLTRYKIQYRGINAVTRLTIGAIIKHMP